MLTKDFVVPEAEIAKRETRKRINILDQVVSLLQPTSTALVVFGSLASGRNYSIHEKSDIDLLILTSPDRVGQISALNLFNRDLLTLYVEGYLKNIGKQFSLDTVLDEITVECHFWDQEAYFNALALTAAETTRFRSSSKGLSVNYSYSFDGSEYAVNLLSKQKDKWILSPFPSYFEKDAKFYPCRPLTNVLGSPLIKHGEELLKVKIDQLWTLIAKKLIEVEIPVRLSEYNVLKALPGNWKFSPEAKEYVMERTKKELEKLGASYLP